MGESVDITLLGVPRRFTADLRERMRDLGSPNYVVEESRDFHHLKFDVAKEISAIARVYNLVWQEARRRWPTCAAAAFLRRAKYTDDPNCVVPRCDRDHCKLVCGKDLWRTAQYWTATDDIRADCDDIELLLSGMKNSGVPLFIRPEGGNQGHVMHLAEPYSILAIDYCIPAGMRRWRGPRECFFFDGRKQVNGKIRWVDGPAHYFECKW